MTNEELEAIETRVQHRTWRISIVAILLAVLALFALADHGCRLVSRCPVGQDVRSTCGMAMTPECIMAMRKNCQ